MDETASRDEGEQKRGWKKKLKNEDVILGRCEEKEACGCETDGGKEE